MCRAHHNFHLNPPAYCAHCQPTEFTSSQPVNDKRTCRTLTFLPSELDAALNGTLPSIHGRMARPWISLGACDRRQKVGHRHMHIARRHLNLQERYPRFLSSTAATKEKHCHVSPNIGVPKEKQRIALRLFEAVPYNQPQSNQQTARLDRLRETYQAIFWH